MKISEYTFLILIAALTGLSSCSKENNFVSDQNISVQPVIKVSTTEYESESPMPRATDNDEEFKTTLAAGDQIGIYSLVNGKVIGKNVPYTYNGTSWEKGAEAAPIIASTNFSCFAYYPYRQELDDKTIANIDDIIANFDVSADQSTHELYTKNDLMTATGSLNLQTNTLSFTLNHALALIVVDLKGRISHLYKGGYTLYGSSVNNITKKKIGSVTSPYESPTGTFRALVKSGDIATDIAYTTSEDKTVTYTGTIASQSGKYSRKHVYAGGESEQAEINIGDYYNSDGSISSTYDPNTSIGLVFYVGNGENDISQSGLSVVHGYVVALQYANDKSLGMAWTVLNENILAISTDTDSDNGYDNTKKVLDSGNLDDYPAFKCAKEYPVATPPVSSEWFLPSSHQAEYLVNNSSKLNGKTGFYNLNGASSAYTAHTWTSTKASATLAYDVDLAAESGAIQQHEFSFTFAIRPILAF